MKLRIPVPRWLTAHGTRFMPFADAASPELPMARLLRLSLFQVVIGMVTALLVGTLNRVMIVELQVPAWWVALAVAIPMVFAPLRTLIGYRSDTHPSALGLRRIPYMWTGTLLLFGGLSIMPFALLLLSEPEAANLWVGQLGACLAFVLVGAGIQVTQTAGMALAHDLASDDKRPRVVALLYSMLLVGMIASSAVFGLILSDFSPQKLIQLVQGCAVMVAVMNLASLWKQEARSAKRGRREAGGFASSWHGLMAQPQMRRFLWTLALGTFAFNMQDIVLEPYAAEILKLDVGATSALTALSAGGALLAFLLSARWLSGGMHACRLASLGVLLGLPAFAMVIFSGPLEATWMFRIGVGLIGFSGGLFSVGMLVTAMGMAADGSPLGHLGGLVIGTWGAVQATSAGAAMALGGALRDGVSVLAMSGALGEVLVTPITAYSFVYHLEMYLLFVVLVALGPMLRASRLAARAVSTPTQPFGLAQLPGCYTDFLKETAMETGAITQYVDVAQIVLYMFWAFFAGLIYYLLRENHREGYPMDSGRENGPKIEGWPPVPEPKAFKTQDGHTYLSPDLARPDGEYSAQPTHGWNGAPLEPVGDPLLAGVGPGAWAMRADIPDADPHGHPKIVPLRVATDHSVAKQDVDPRGLPVWGADKVVAGTVVDLWVDRMEMMFRYAEVQLANSDKRVLLPMTFARIKKDGTHVQAILGHQFANVPQTKSNAQITLLEEEKITAYYGAGTLYATPERQEPII